MRGEQFGEIVCLMRDHTLASGDVVPAKSLALHVGVRRSNAQKPHRGGALVMLVVLPGSDSTPDVVMMHDNPPVPAPAVCVLCGASTVGVLVSDLAPQKRGRPQRLGRARDRIPHLKIVRRCIECRDERRVVEWINSPTTPTA